MFRAVSRMISVVLGWLAFPDHRFVVIPALIVQLISIFTLPTRQLPLAARGPSQPL